jgi:starch phosphorylase
MKASIGALCHYFNTHRMVGEYTKRFYLPAASRYQQLLADGMARAKALAAWKARVQASWPQVRVETVETATFTELKAGDEVQVKARVRLGALTPDDVTVELCLGRVNDHGEIVTAEATPMQPVGPAGDGSWHFAASIVPYQSGLHGYTVRLLPRHPDLTTPFVPGLIVWA